MKNPQLIKYGTSLLTAGMIMVLAHGCYTIPVPTFATVTTSAVTDITETTAVTGGTVTSDGGSPVDLRGVCWGPSPNPVLESGNRIFKGVGTGPFTITLTGLLPNTTYHVRSFANNYYVGMTYGIDVSFKTIPSVTDLDGNSYGSVSIGDQIWMTENLKVTVYNDGTSIPIITDNTDWQNSTAPGYCWLNNDETTNKESYGALYNWYVVETAKLCPTGWHVPSPYEWAIMGAQGSSYDLKEAGSAHWENTNPGTNASGFTALPAGGRLSGGLFVTGEADWWTVQEEDPLNGLDQQLGPGYANVMTNATPKSYGLSVRCVKD